MARAKNTLTQRIALEGGSEVRKELYDMGKAGGDAFAALNKHVQEVQRASEGLNGRLLNLRTRFSDLGNSVQRLGTRFGFLNTQAAKLGGTIAAAFSIRALVDMTGQWTDYTSRIRLAIPATEDVDAVMKRLQQTARGTYSSLGNTIEGFVSNSTALKELGLSTKQQLDFQEALNNALVVSGARGEQAASVNYSLTKAMSLGVLRGAELNSVIARGGRVAELLAEHFGVTRGELLRLGQAGEITAGVIQSVLLGSMEKLREEAASMPATIADGFILINNALLGYVGNADQASGLSSMLAEALVWVADNIDIVANAAIALAGAFLLVKGVGLAADLISIAAALVKLVPALVAVGVALLANPMTLWALAITGAAVAILALTGNLDKFVGAVGEVIKPVYEAMSAMMGFGKESDESLTDTTKAANNLTMALDGNSSGLVKIAEDSADTASSLGDMGQIGVDASESISEAVGMSANSIVDLRNEVEATIKSFERLGEAISSTGSGGGDSSSTPGFAGGGSVHGPGTGTSDSILSRLSNGEFVMRAAAVRKFGVGFMHALNGLRMPSFATGGLVEGLTSRLPPTASWMPSMSSITSASSGGRPLNLTIGDETFEGLSAPSDVADRLTRYVLGRQVRSAGRRPNWYGGK
jgi:tape measure domain-containing protein